MARKTMTRIQKSMRAPQLPGEAFDSIVELYHSPLLLVSVEEALELSEEPVGELVVLAIPDVLEEDDAAFWKQVELVEEVFYLRGPLQLLCPAFRRRDYELPLAIVLAPLEDSPPELQGIVFIASGTGDVDSC
jgi:hypothetical protein